MHCKISLWLIWVGWLIWGVFSLSLSLHICTWIYIWYYCLSTSKLVKEDLFTLFWINKWSGCRMDGFLILYVKWTVQNKSNAPCQTLDTWIKVCHMYSILSIKHFLHNCIQNCHYRYILLLNCYKMSKMSSFYLFIFYALIFHKTPFYPTK